MKTKSSLQLSFFLLVVSIIVTFFPQLVYGRNIEEEIQRNGELKVGVREDSPLFGLGTKKEGYCADFAQELANNLSLKYNQPIKVNFVTSNNENRWDLVKKGIVHFECGPNTITTKREAEHKIKFSQPFFVTATQILVRKSTNSNMAMSRNGTIGYTPATTTEAELKSVYPHEELNDAFTDISKGILAVNRGEIFGFASDGILLIGTTINLDLSLENFNFVTPVQKDRPFCAAYGMILPGGEDNLNWRNMVNNLIAQNGQGAVIWDNWFLSLLPYLTSVLNVCQ